MLVKFLALSAKPNVTYLPGDVVDVSDEEGKALVAGGYAKKTRERLTRHALEEDLGDVEEVDDEQDPDDEPRPRGRTVKNKQTR